MRNISAKDITKTIAGLCIKANTELPPAVKKSLLLAERTEKQARPLDALIALVENAKIAKKEKLPICQDTGVAIVFVEIGQNVKITGGDLNQAIMQGVRVGYKRGYLRKSVVNDPLLRKNTHDNTPAIIHVDIARGSKIKLTVMPKGFGCENKSRSIMLNPTARVSDVEKFVVDAIKNAGSDACPPYIIGVGIGGTADYAALLAKKALLRSATRRTLHVARHMRKLEQNLLKKINKLNIGAMGFGGKHTCLGVYIETYPTHIAGLPVAVNISCHAMRVASRTI